MTEQSTIATAHTHQRPGGRRSGAAHAGGRASRRQRAAGQRRAVFRRPPASLAANWPLPDGEPGPRSDWILWQYPVFSALPQFEVGPPGADTYRTLPKLRLRDGERAEDIVLDNLGFADAAISSFAIFAKLKRDGVIPGHVRFQVSLPTPLAPVSAFIDPEHQALVEPIYEARVLCELERIFAAVPHDQLALQWDTRLEFAILEGISPAWFVGRPRRRARAPPARQPRRARGRRARLPSLLRRRLPRALRRAARRPQARRGRERARDRACAGR